VAKLLYIGETWEGSTCRDRMLALQSLGNEIVPFDTTRYYVAGPRLLRSIAHRTNIGLSVLRINKGLQSFISRMRSVDYVWVDRGKWISPNTLKRIKEKFRIPIIHYTPDPQLFYHRSQLFDSSIPEYDLLFTTKRFELAEYKRRGARKVVLTFPAFEKTRFFPRTPSEEARERYESDILLVGHYENHYAHCLAVAAQSNSRVRVWGPHWIRNRRRHKRSRFEISGEGIWGEEYPQALCSTKIALGLLSKYIPETVTTRTVEIPACGVFMLGERTGDHLTLFEEGKEAEFFDSDEELFDKLRYYLIHENERIRIGSAGRDRCLRSGYSNHDRLREMMSVIYQGI